MPDMSSNQARDQRYDDFLELAAKWEGFWGLYHHGWLLHTSSGQTFCPVFARREDAQSWGASIQTNHIPVPITLIDAIEHIVPDWRENGVMAGVSPTPALAPVMVAPGDLSADLLDALKTAMAKQFGRT